MEGSRENIDRMTDLKKLNVIFTVYFVESLPKFFVFTFQLQFFLQINFIVNSLFL